MGKSDCIWKPEHGYIHQNKMPPARVRPSAAKMLSLAGGKKYQYRKKRRHALSGRGHVHMMLARLFGSGPQKQSLIGYESMQSLEFPRVLL